MDGISLLADHILAHAYLKEIDRAVIRNLCSSLALREELGAVNQSIIQQVELEAAVAYLVSKYSGLCDAVQRGIDDLRTGRLVELGSRDDAGLRWTANSKEQWLRENSPPYVIQSQVLRECEALVSALKSLHAIVFGRDRKLEQLSNNYRREILTDRT